MYTKNIIKNILNRSNFEEIRLSISKKYGFCHFIPVFKAGKVSQSECFVKLYITIIAPIIARAFLKERKDFLFLNLLLIVEKNLSERLCENSPYFRQRPHFVRGYLLLKAEVAQVANKIFINIILKIIKKVNTTFLKRRRLNDNTRRTKRNY